MAVKTLAFLLFAGLLAIVVYQLTSRLSDQAVDIAVGVLCGIGASIPVSLGLLVALTRQRARAEVEETTTTYPTAPPRKPSTQAYPPVIVVSPQPGQLPPGYNNYLPPGNMHEPPASRDFRIIGDDDTLDA